MIRLSRRLTIYPASLSASAGVRKGMVSCVSRVERLRAVPARGQNASAAAGGKAARTGGACVFGSTIDRVRANMPLSGRGATLISCGSGEPYHLLVRWHGDHRDL